jgi:hypothetical protein
MLDFAVLALPFPQPLRLLCPVMLLPVLNRRAADSMQGRIADGRRCGTSGQI